MLLTAVHLKLSREDYYLPSHPIQREIISTLSKIADLGEDVPTAIDGCSAPTFAVPLSSLAVAFARLASSVQADQEASPSLDSDLREAGGRVVAAMIELPEMVSGT